MLSQIETSCRKEEQPKHCMSWRRKVDTFLRNSIDIPSCFVFITESTDLHTSTPGKSSSFIFLILLSTNVSIAANCLGHRTGYKN